MNKLRYNTFNGVHKGLRCMLYDAANAIQRTNFEDVEQSESSIQKIETALLLFHTHATHEDEYLFPNVHPVNSNIIDELEEEHEKDHALSEGLKSAIDRYRKCSTDLSRNLIGIEILQLFNEFVAFNLQHMNKEETKINPLLWATYTDEEIKEIEKRLVASIKPQELMIMGEWLMRGQNAVEINKWMNEIRAKSPFHLYEAVVSLGKKVHESNWEEIMQLEVA